MANLGRKNNGFWKEKVWNGKTEDGGIVIDRRRDVSGNAGILTQKGGRNVLKEGAAKKQGKVGIDFNPATKSGHDGRNSARDGTFK